MGAQPANPLDSAVQGGSRIGGSDDRGVFDVSTADREAGIEEVLQPQLRPAIERTSDLSPDNLLTEIALDSVAASVELGQTGKWAVVLSSETGGQPYDRSVVVSLDGVSGCAREPIPLPLTEAELRTVLVDLSDPEEGEQVMIPRPAETTLSKVIFTPGDESILKIGRNGAVREVLLGGDDGSVTDTGTTLGPGRFLAASEDGRRVALLSDHEYGFQAVLVKERSSEGNWNIVACLSGVEEGFKFQEFFTPEGELVTEEFSREIFGAFFMSKDGQAFAVHDQERGMLKVYGLYDTDSSPVLLDQIPAENRIVDVAFSPDNSVIAVVEEEKRRVDLPGLNLHTFNLQKLIVREVFDPSNFNPGSDGFETSLVSFAGMKPQVSFPDGDTLFAGTVTVPPTEGWLPGILLGSTDASDPSGLNGSTSYFAAFSIDRDDFGATLAGMKSHRLVFFGDNTPGGNLVGITGNRAFLLPGDLRSQEGDLADIGTEVLSGVPGSLSSLGANGAMLALVENVRGAGSHHLNSIFRVYGKSVS